MSKRSQHTRKTIMVLARGYSKKTLCCFVMLAAASIILFTGCPDSGLLSGLTGGGGNTRPVIFVSHQGNMVTHNPIEQADYIVFKTVNIFPDEEFETFQVTNTGTSQLTVTSITINQSTPSWGSYWSISTYPSQYGIAPETTEEFIVKFIAGSAGWSNAIVSIASNDPDIPEYLFGVRGYSHC